MFACFRDMTYSGLNGGRCKLYVRGMSRVEAFAMELANSTVAVFVSVSVPVQHNYVTGPNKSPKRKSSRFWPPIVVLIEIK